MQKPKSFNDSTKKNSLHDPSFSVDISLTCTYTSNSQWWYVLEKEFQYFWISFKFLSISTPSHLTETSKLKFDLLSPRLIGFFSSKYGGRGGGLLVSGSILFAVLLMWLKLLNRNVFTPLTFNQHSLKHRPICNTFLDNYTGSC